MLLLGVQFKVISDIVTDLARDYIALFEMFANLLLNKHQSGKVTALFQKKDTSGELGSP